MIRDRLHDIFPQVHIPLEIIGWHISQSTPIEAICSNVASEILSFGEVIDPRKTESSIEEKPPTNVTTTASTLTAMNDDALQSLYDVFISIPHDHIKNTYVQLKNPGNPNWYDDIVNELLSYSVEKPSTNKRSYDEMNTEDAFIPDEYNRLLAVLPDIDPDYAFESYMNHLQSSSNKIDLNVLIASLIEHGYVKITDKLERLRNERLKENFRNPKFEIDEFLKTFSNPLEYFYDRTKRVSESYKTHAYIYLANAFARVSSDYIKEVLARNNHRFAPAMKQLQEEFFTYHVNQNNEKNNINHSKF